MLILVDSGQAEARGFFNAFLFANDKSHSVAGEENGELGHEDGEVIS